MLNGKNSHTCPICNELTHPDEWADNYSCINCGPVSTYFLIDYHIK